MQYSCLYSDLMYKFIYYVKTEKEKNITHKLYLFMLLVKIKMLIMCYYAMNGKKN